MLALLFIVLAILALVQQQRVPKMRSHCVQQARAQITMPTESILNAITDISAFWICSGGPFYCTLKGKIVDSYIHTNNNREYILFLYKYYVNCIILHFSYASRIALAFLQLEKNIQMKIYAQNLLH